MGKTYNETLDVLGSLQTLACSLPPSELARIAQVNLQTVYNWIQRGKLLTFRLPNGRIRIPSTEVQRITGQNPQESIESIGRVL